MGSTEGGDGCYVLGEQGHSHGTSKLLMGRRPMGTSSEVKGLSYLHGEPASTGGIADGSSGRPVGPDPVV